MQTRPRKVEALLLIMAQLQALQQAIFPSRMRYGESGSISLQCNRNLEWKIREQYDRRMEYLSKHGRRR